MQYFLDKQGLARMADAEPAAVPDSESEPELEPQTTRDETVLPQVADGPAQQAVARKKAPINFMRGQPPYDVRELLSGKVPNITVPQLLNSAPVLRRKLAILQRSSQPLTRKCKTAAPLGAHNNMVLITTTSEDDREIGCTDLGIRMADDTAVPLPSHVWLDISVTGILVRIKAFVMLIRLSYNILLSRRWLARLNALEDHKNILYIPGIDDKRKIVQGTLAQAPGAKTVNLAPIASHLTQGEYGRAEKRD